MAPFVVGIYEAQLEVMDQEVAHLFEEYLEQGGYNLMQYQPSLHRVVPSQSALKSEWILPYDKLIELMNSCNTFRVNDCVCRKQQELIGGKRCNFPLHVELVFYTGGESSEPPVAPFVTKEEALAVLNQTEELGLVHTVSNVAEGVYYVCNCCGCCCAILRGITDFGIAKSIAAANYYSTIDPALCKGCGTCINRCQVHATSLRDGVSVVDRSACIGCGLCVTGCPAKAAQLEPKPASERVDPPQNFAGWEHERLVSRGME